jgi:RimK family alpha-L-glutamate ligase
MRAFEDLGGDVVVKPLFGSMGLGIARVEDPDIAHRVFGALEVERAVYYLQETLPHSGRDLRAFVVGDDVLAVIERFGAGWRANIARGAQARPARLTAEQEAMCLRAAAALGADYAGVDLLTSPERGDHVLEVNGIPGWHGLQRTTGADVAGALVGRIEALVAAG